MAKLPLGFSCRAGDDMLRRGLIQISGIKSYGQTGAEAHDGIVLCWKVTYLKPYWSGNLNFDGVIKVSGWLCYPYRYGLVPLNIVVWAPKASFFYWEVLTVLCRLGMMLFLPVDAKQRKTLASGCCRFKNCSTSSGLAVLRLARRRCSVSMRTDA